MRTAAWVSGLMRQQASLVWGCAVWLGLVAVVRHALSRRIPLLATRRPDFARYALRASVLANGISWGLLTAASIVLPELAPIRMAMIIVAVGLCSAGSMAMAIDSFLRYAFPVAETGFDPAQISDLYSHTITANIFESLYRYDYAARPAKIVPNIATAMR